MRRIAPLLVLFILAYLPRALGADSGYFFGDERINDAAKVLTGVVVPGQHFYPPLLNYINAIAFGLLFGVGLLLGWWDTTAEFRAQYFDDPTVFYITARLVVAALGAFLAPLAYLIAAKMGLRNRQAFAVGLVAAFFPLAVYLSHFAKSDVPLATGTVLCFWASLGRLNAKSDRLKLHWDLMFGVAFALAMSFKHSAIFGLLPLAIGVFILLGQQQGMASAIRSYWRAFVVFLVAWPSLNIGIVLDFKRFLSFQKIQSTMSLQEQDTAWQGLGQLFQTLFSPMYGLGWILASVAILAPFLLRLRNCKIATKPALIIFWLSSVIGMATVSILAGLRQPDQLFIAPFAELAILTSILLAGLTMGVHPYLRGLGWAGLLATITLFAITTYTPVSQALRPPLTTDVDRYLYKFHAEDQIVTMMRTQAPQSAKAKNWEIRRLDRLAEKYQVKLPEVAPERHYPRGGSQPLFYVALPQTMFGLEGIEDGDQSFEVQAHAWPLQPEEWVLGHWKENGFSVFVLTDVAHHLKVRPSERVSRFFEEIIRECSIAKSFDPHKPMFLEYLTQVYAC